VQWTGCSLHDLIQPSFSFLVGVALPFSLMRRKAEGQPEWQRTLHAFWRAFILVLLGVFLRSVGSDHTNWTFEDTLSQIGLGYGFLYILAHRSVRFQWVALAVLLIGYWLAFALYPLPGKGFDWARAGAHAYFSGFAAHWNLNTNAAWAFDTWFLNLKIFGREHPFTHNGGGYSTLSFIPTLGTMVFGLIAGGVLSSGRKPWEKVRWMAVAGTLCLASGWLLGFVGVCPVVKKIWTPSWTLFSGGGFSAFGCVLSGDRHWELAGLGVPAGGDRDEFDRRLPDRPPVCGVYWEALPRHLGRGGSRLRARLMGLSCMAPGCCSVSG
jgi:predicted acyltransferase